METLYNNLLMIAIVVTIFSKILTDATKMIINPESKYVIVAALVWSCICSALLTVYANIPLTKSNIAGIFLTAILAFGAAIGVTELQKKARQVT